jgi:tetratricopeptide (TPR) repeat protein
MTGEKKENYRKPERHPLDREGRKNTTDFDDKEAVRAIAFYLPQYHPIPENDKWWGKGFTEWTKVSRATPQFAGHYQPHLPADLGFYDLRVPEVRDEQAAMARKYGISGFCYYHYWFAGKRLLERPFEEVLKSGEPDFPFCLCWANENWTRRWDGADQQVLIAQQHSSVDDLAFIRDVIPAFRDPRYIRIHNRPLFLVYRVGILPEPNETVSRWRNECIAAGVGNPYLCMVQTFGSVDPRPFGFDAAIEFPPLNLNIVQRPTYPFKGNLGYYEDIVEKALQRPVPTFTWFRGVIPSWDNTPRRGEDGIVIHGSRPQLYDNWLSNIVQWTCEHRSSGERLVFINAWNEWAEGCHLEPDAFYGYGYLEATRSALRYESTSRKDVVNIDKLMQDAVPHLQAGRLKEAETFYQQVLDQQANHPGALHMLGLLKYQSGDKQGAVELIERAITVKPDFADAYTNAANIYAELGQMENAIIKYQQALKIEPNLHEVHYHLATVYLTLQRLDEARAHYEKAISINPNFVEARNKLTEIQQIISRTKEQRES